MTVLDEVMSALFTTWVSGNAARLAQLREPFFASRENLVHIGLVACIPQHHVRGALKYSVQCNGQFHGTQIGAQVTTRFRHCLHNELANFGR